MQTLEEIKKAFIEDSVDTSDELKTHMKWWKNQHLGLKEDEVKSFIEEKIKTNKSIIEEAYDFIKSNISEYSAQMIMGHAFSEKDSNGFHDITDDFRFFVSIYKNEKKKKDEFFLIPGEFKKDVVERQKNKDYVFCTSFIQFVFRVINARKIEKINLAIEKIKAPNSLLNTMLTSKNKTLKKIKEKVSKIEKLIEENPNEKPNLIKNLDKVKDLFNRCKNNFPDNFNFSVYEHYAIFGAFKLLSKNNYNAIEMRFVDILEALNFKVNKADISNIKQAFVRLTQEKFPCYAVRETGNNNFIIHDDDSPIFRIRTINMLDLNIGLKDKEILREKLVLKIENYSLMQDLEQFYMLINSNILRDLREYKKRVHEVDLYFIEYIIKEHHFKRKKTEISLVKLCLTIKKKDFLNEDVTAFKNRDKRYRFKDLILNLSNFLKIQNILKSFEIDDKTEKVIFKYAKQEEGLIS